MEEECHIDRQWICIRERKFLGTEFVDILDSYRYCFKLRMHGENACKRYNVMICVLQELTEDYLEGNNYIEEQLMSFFEQHYMEFPVERRLPAALEELFEQLESKLNIDFTEMLDQCVNLSNKAYSHMQEEQQREKERILLIKSLMRENRIDENKDKNPQNQIRKLLLLQRAKKKSDLYKLNENEINVTRVWCDLLVSSFFSEAISYGLMLRLVENEILAEAEINNLLENKYNIKKDYEWCSEDFIGCSLEEPTDIKIEDILELCSGRVEKVIGVKI